MEADDLADTRVRGASELRAFESEYEIRVLHLLDARELDEPRQRSPARCEQRAIQLAVMPCTVAFAALEVDRVEARRPQRVVRSIYGTRRDQPASIHQRGWCVSQEHARRALLIERCCVRTIRPLGIANGIECRRELARISDTPKRICGRPVNVLERCRLARDELSIASARARIRGVLPVVSARHQATTLPKLARKTHHAENEEGGRGLSSSRTGQSQAIIRTCLPSNDPPSRRAPEGGRS